MSTEEKIARMAALFGTSDSNESRPSNYYRFYDMNFGETATVRLLPDANGNNPMIFTVEKLMHNLTINGERRSVPCMKMYDKNADCPVCKVSSAFYKEEGKESVNGKKYWRKKQHIFQCLVLEDPLPPNPETGENSEGKIRFLNLGYQLFSVINEALTSGELEEYPWDVRGGYDFVIKKTQDSGGNAKYDLGSKFARYASSLTEDQIALVEEESIDLSTLIPPQMDYEKMEAMLNASLTGEHYDDGYSNNAAASNPAAASAPVVETPVATPAPVVEQAAPAATAAPTPTPAAETPAATPTAEEFTEKGNDVLEMIRNRKSAEV